MRKLLSNPLVLTVLVVILLGAGYYFFFQESIPGVIVNNETNSSTTPPAANNADSSSEETPSGTGGGSTEGIAISLASIKVGTQLGNFIVTKTAVQKIADAKSEFVINFKGEATVSGKYEYSRVGDIVCFTPNRSDYPKLPDIKEITGEQNFCLDSTARLLLGEEGTATIVIKDYTINHLPLGINNTTRLSKVISKKEAN